MARVTVEDCLENLQNRFALVVLAAKRARELSAGVYSEVECDNKPAVTALREIAAKKVYFKENVGDVIQTFVDEQKEIDEQDLPSDR